MNKTDSTCIPDPLQAEKDALSAKLYGLAVQTGSVGMLMQWAEELGELQHEVLKLARILAGVSPTPALKDDVRMRIYDEMVDCMICRRGCGFAQPSFLRARDKIDRWAERMEEHDANGTIHLR